MTPQEPGDEVGRETSARLFVRRLPDVQTFWRTRRRYEVAWMVPGDPTPVRVERTRNPGSVLVKAGQHTTDIHDCLKSADSAWTGGVGPWRGFYPYERP